MKNLSNIKSCVNKVFRNILKHSLWKKSLKLWLWDHDLRNYSKLEELRKNKNKSFTVQIDEHILIGFALPCWCLEDNEHENEYVCYNGEYCLDVFY